MAMKDQISALMDDELSPDSADHLITAIKSGGESAGCWAVYHMIGDAMRGNPIFTTDFQKKVMSKLADEPTILSPKPQKSYAPKSYVKTPAVWSLAASVAAVMFVGWIVLQQTQQGEMAPLEIAQNLPAEYLLAHQASAPSNAAYYIQPAGYSENGK
jgi:sigma-E factor negative regulatory protein RseA